MNKDFQKLRKKYPDRVPVLCVDTIGKGKQSKLLVPSDMNGKAFKKVVLDKAQWPKSAIMKVGGLPVPDDVSVAELDRKHMSPDGLLHVRCHTEMSPTHSVGPDAEQGQQIAETASGKASKGDPHVSFEVKQGSEEQATQPRASIISFHLPDEDPEDFRSAFDDMGKPEYKNLSKVMKKNPECVPVRCRQEACAESGLPKLDKKFLVPVNMRFSEFQKVFYQKVRNDIPRHGKADAQLFIEGVTLTIDARMSDLYDEYKADDSLLYVGYGTPVPSLMSEGGRCLSYDTAEDEEEEDEGAVHQKVLAELDQVRLTAEAELQQEQLAAADKISALEAELASCRFGAQESAMIFTSTIADKDTEISDLRARLENTTLKLDKAIAVHEADHLQARESSSAEISVLKAELDCMVCANSRADEMTSALQLQLEKLRTELQKQEAKSAATIEDMEARLQDARQALSTFQDKTKASTADEVGALQSELKAALLQRNATSNEAQRRADEVAALKSELKTALSDRDAARDEAQRAAAKLTCAIEESTNRWTEIQALKVSHKEARTEMKEMKSTQMERESELKQVKGEAARRLEDVTDLKNQLQRLTNSDEAWVYLEDE